MWDDRNPKMAWKATAQRDIPKEDPKQTSEEGIQKILKKRGNCMERSKSYGSRL
jgi:hypothetical protein